MTVPELIEDVLRRIRSTDRYHGRIREFKRDEQALMRAVARYGYACNERGWHFQCEDILRDLLALLRQIEEQQAEIQYFPIYLEYAVDKHIRTRAEELNARAKAAQAVPRLTDKIVNGSQVVKIERQSDVETLAVLYGDLKKRRKQSARARVKPARQGVLL